MDPIAATWQLTLTARRPAPDEADVEPVEAQPPTIPVLSEALARELSQAFPGLTFSASSVVRTD